MFEDETVSDKEIDMFIYKYGLMFSDQKVNPYPIADQNGKIYDQFSKQKSLINIPFWARV